MIITLAAGELPAVQIIMAGSELPAGSRWQVTAHFEQAGRPATYQVRGGTGIGMGAQVALLDQAAPIRTPITYILTRDGENVASGMVTRPAPAADIIMDLRGTKIVPGIRTQKGGDSRYSVRRSYASEVPGNPFPPRRLAPVAGAGGGDFHFVTRIPHTGVMRDLMAANTLVYLLHSCQIPECDIPLTCLGYITNDKNQAVGATARDWALSYELAADPEPHLVTPLSTWAEYNKRLTAITWADYDKIIAGMNWDHYDLIDWDQV